MLQEWEFASFLVSQLTLQRLNHLTMIKPVGCCGAEKIKENGWKITAAQQWISFSNTKS
jgi:hypothetical protein